MAWIVDVTTGATMATEFNALQSAFTTLDGDFDTFLAGFNASVDARIALANLDNLVDVTITAPANNDVLTYETSSGLWKNKPATGGGGSPGGSTGEIQYNNGGVFAGAADVEIEGGQLRLPSIATPATPAAGGIKLFTNGYGNKIEPAFLGPDALKYGLQAKLGQIAHSWWQATGNNGADSQSGMVAGSTGTSSSVLWAATNFRTRMQWREWLVTVAATTAVAGWRGDALRHTVGGGTGTGGFDCCLTWSPATGVISTHRGFAGMMASVSAPTDVNPSTILNMVGMGYDAADANIQFMHNDGSGAATKIDLGASFPKPTADRTKVYRICMYSPPGTTQEVSYKIEDLETGAVVTGVVNTNLPSTTTAIGPYAYVSVGGISSVIGLGVRRWDIFTRF